MGRRSAAEVRKGDRPVMVLGESAVERLLDPAALLDGLQEGFRALARGRIQTPERPEITVPGRGFLLAMPAWAPGGPMMVKTVNVFEGNLALGLPNHLATIQLFDEATGRALCVMDGTHITGLRTAAGAVLSVRLLARPEARIATLVGAGVQGREHLRLLPLARRFETILVSSLVHEDAERLAATSPLAEPVRDLEAAVRASDVVCLATHAYEPAIEAAWVRPGTHVTSVGYAPPRGELPPALLGRARLFVEHACAFAPPPVGCAELAGRDPAGGTALGDALLAPERLRRDPREITLYKAMGVAMEDLVAARLVYQAALDEGGAATALL